MLLSLKRMFVLIPCMIFGLFLINSTDVLAKDAVLVGAESISVGGNSKENKYYFSNSRTWEFKAIAELDDRLLQYRVIQPNGKATDWIDSYFVDNNGIFVINDYMNLSYTQTVDVSKRNSIAPAATYYVEIEYYWEMFRLGFTRVNQEKGEILKIIVNDKSDTNSNYPVASLKFSDQDNKYILEASILKEGKGNGVITSASYYFSTEVKNNDTNKDFEENKKKSIYKGELSFTPSSVVSVAFDNINDDSYKYVYAIVETGNGYSKVVRFDIDNGQSDAGEDNMQQTTNKSDDKGLYDYGF